MEGDAFAALALLRADPRIDPAPDRRHGRLQGRRGDAQCRHRRAPALARAASLTCSTSMSRSAPAPPPSTAMPRRTAGRCSSCWPARDDYTPAPLAIEYAERMRSAGNDRIKVKVYGSAHHGWESIGPVFDIKDAENWSCCRNFIEDDGSHFVPAAGRAMSEPEYQAWARQHCVTRGARAGGGTPELEAACDGGSARLPAQPWLRASMDESDVSGYTCGVIRLRFLAVVLAFVVPILGSLPPLPMRLCGSDRTPPRPAPRRLLKAIRGAADHGLRSRLVPASPTSRRRWQPAADPRRPRRCSPTAFVAYASDVSTGRVRANRVDKDIDIQQRKVERADLAEGRRRGRRISPPISRALPPKGDYPALQKALAAWRDKRAKATFTPLPDGDRAEARHDRSARAAAAQAPGRARPRGSRAGARWPISTTSRWPPW